MTLTLGDPAAMRWKASDLRARAADVRTRIEWIRNQIAAMQFEGPAAERFRERMAQWERDSDSVASELDDVASYLFRQADVLEEIQRAERRLVGHP